MQKMLYALVFVMFSISLDAMKQSKRLSKNLKFLIFSKNRTPFLKSIKNRKSIHFQATKDPIFSHKNVPFFHEGADEKSFGSPCIIYGDFRHDKLFEAVKERNIKDIIYLFEHGADPNTQDDEGITPLHHAVLHNMTRIVGILLENNADPNILDNNGKTSLHYAVKNYTSENSKIVQMLLSYNANPNICN